MCVVFLVLQVVCCEGKAPHWSPESARYHKLRLKRVLGRASRSSKDQHQQCGSQGQASPKHPSNHCADETREIRIESRMAVPTPSEVFKKTSEVFKIKELQTINVRLAGVFPATTNFMCQLTC